MAVDFSWTWGPMTVEDIDGLKDVIIGINWRCVAIDSDTHTEGLQSGLLQLPPPDQDNFITLNNVTAEIVNNWIASYMNKDDVESLCVQSINEILNPPIRNVPFPL